MRSLQGIQDSDIRKSLLDMLIGVPEDDTSKDIQIDDTTVAHIGAKEVFAMTDDQRMELFNTIVKQVSGNE